MSPQTRVGSTADRRALPYTRAVSPPFLEFCFVLPPIEPSGVSDPEVEKRERERRSQKPRSQTSGRVCLPSRIDE